MDLAGCGGAPLIHYRGREGLKLEGHITIEPAAALRPDLSLLVGAGLVSVGAARTGPQRHDSGDDQHVIIRA